jgi:hypothetical protein
MANNESEHVKEQTCPACGVELVGEQLPKHLRQDCDPVRDYRRGGGEE